VPLMIKVITGNGAGKTTSALGTALRALGHGKKVVVIQFLKGRKNIGEYKFQKIVKNFKLFQFGRKEFIDLKNPTRKDKELAIYGLEFAKKILKEKPFLIVLDEINLASHIGLVDKEKVIEFLKKLPKNVNVILTGRYAPDEFKKIADVVVVVEELKRKRKKAIRGIEY